MRIAERFIALFKRRYVYRRADNGRFCSEAYAREYPDTTYRVLR